MLLTGYYCTSLVLRVLALLLLGVKVLPKQYKEAKIGNGLKIYRQMLFIFGLALFASTLIPFIIALNNVMGNPFGLIQEHIAAINSINDLLIAIILYMIYNMRGGE